MDDWKRFYSNNDEDKSVPYFWEKFDKANYSIWYCEYKYVLVFFSSIVIRLWIVKIIGEIFLF